MNIVFLNSSNENSYKQALQAAFSERLIFLFFYCCCSKKEGKLFGRELFLLLENITNVLI